MMSRCNPVTSWNEAEKLPVINDLAYVDRSAVLIGEVVVERGAAIYPGAVIRADEGSPIVIGEGTNVQDGVIMHALKGTGIEVGAKCSIAHGAVVHGPCRVGEGTFVGFKAILLKTNIGSNCFISHGSMVIGVDVPDCKFIPAGQVIDSVEKVKGLNNTENEMREFAHEVQQVNEELLRGYKKIT